MAYTEAQVEQFCGIHALNMLLQEQKLVWFREGPEYLYRSLLSDADEANAAFLAASKAYQIAEAETQSLGFLKAEPKAIAAARQAEKGPRNAMKKALKKLKSAMDDADASSDEFETPDVCLNMWNRCTAIKQTADAIGDVNIAFLCDLDGVGVDGQIPFDVVKDVVESLKYETAVLFPGDPKLPFNLIEFDEFFNKPNCIGAFVNFKHPQLFRHYAAIVKFPGGPGIAWADSHDVPIMTYMTVEEIKAKIVAMRAVGDFNALCFVMAKEDSAVTVALERLRESGKSEGEGVAAGVAPVAAAAGAGSNAPINPPPLLEMLRHIATNAKPENGAPNANKATRRGRKARKTTRKNRNKY
jgi:hypothetical protein